jgi:predicted deacylase
MARGRRDSREHQPFCCEWDLSTYKATIKERNIWIDMLIRMADHASVVLVAGNHGAELSGDL